MIFRIGENFIFPYRQRNKKLVFGKWEEEIPKAWEDGIKEYKHKVNLGNIYTVFLRYLKKKQMMYKIRQRS